MNSDEHQNNDNISQKFLSVNQAADFSRLTPRHVRLLLSRGKIKGFKMGRDWFTTEEAVQEYLDQDRKPGPKPKKD